MDDQTIQPLAVSTGTIPTGVPLPTVCLYHPNNTMVAISSTRLGLCETCATCLVTNPSKCGQRGRVVSTVTGGVRCADHVLVREDGTVAPTVPLTWLDEVPDAVRTRAADPVPAVQVPPIPDEVRAAGWDALVAARDSNRSLPQAYSRVLDAIALPLYLAWLGDKELVELPEPSWSGTNDVYGREEARWVAPSADFLSPLRVTARVIRGVPEVVLDAGEIAPGVATPAEARERAAVLLAGASAAEALAAKAGA